MIDWLAGNNFKLYFLGLSKEKLKILFSKKPYSEFSSELKAILLQDLSHQHSDTVTLLEYCVKATWDWLRQNKSQEHKATTQASTTSRNCRSLSLDDVKPVMPQIENFHSGRVVNVVPSNLTQTIQIRTSIPLCIYFTCVQREGALWLADRQDWCSAHIL